MLWFAPSVGSRVDTPSEDSWSTVSSGIFSFPSSPSCRWRPSNLPVQSSLFKLPERERAGEIKDWRSVTKIIVVEGWSVYKHKSLGRKCLADQRLNIMPIIERCKHQRWNTGYNRNTGIILRKRSLIPGKIFLTGRYIRLWSCLPREMTTVPIA